MQQHRREQAPPLPRRQAVGQRGELDVLADDAKWQERQPAHGLQVIAKHGHRADDQAEQQNRCGQRAMAQLLEKTKSWILGLK